MYVMSDVNLVLLMHIALTDVQFRRHFFLPRGKYILSSIRSLNFLIFSIKVII